MKIHWKKLKHILITVIARNPKSLSALSSGNASYGARSIVDQAQDYMECAKLYPCMYQPPKASRSVQCLRLICYNKGVIN